MVASDARPRWSCDEKCGLEFSPGWSWTSGRKPISVSSGDVHKVVPPPLSPAAHGSADRRWFESPPRPSLPLSGRHDHLVAGGARADESVRPGVGIEGRRSGFSGGGTVGRPARSALHMAAMMISVCCGTPLHPLGSLDDHAYVCDDAGIKTLVCDPVFFEERAAPPSAVSRIWAL